MRLLGACIGFLLSLLPAVAVANLAPDASWLALPPIWVGCCGLGYLLGSAVDALQRAARAHEDVAQLTRVTFLLATGQYQLGDLVEVRVPDAPPEDLGGGS